MAQQPYWPDVREVLEAEERMIMEKLRDVSGDSTLHQLQGRAQALNDFKKLLANASSYIEKLERLPSGLGNRI
jgi:hypothetical protein